MFFLRHYTSSHILICDVADPTHQRCYLELEMGSTTTCIHIWMVSLTLRSFDVDICFSTLEKS